MTLASRLCAVAQAFLCAAQGQVRSMAGGRLLTKAAAGFSFSEEFRDSLQFSTP